MNKILPIILAVVLSGYSQESISSGCESYSQNPTKLGRVMRLAIENRNILAKKSDRLRKKINYETKLLDILLENGRMDRFYAKEAEIENLINGVYEAEAKVKEADIKIHQASVQQASMDIKVGRTERMNALWSDATGTDIRILLRTDCRFNIYIFDNLDTEGIDGNTLIKKFKQAVE